MKLKELDKLSGNELKEALKTHKEVLIAEKKGTIKFTDGLIHQADITPVETQKKSFNLKEDSEEVDAPFMVTVVCNTANFCDSHMDVLTDEAYKESIKNRGNSIPHIADHKHESTAHVGDVKKVYTKKLPANELGFDSSEETTVLLMDSLIRKDYNEDVYKFYKSGKINQHSIGLSYGEIELAYNSQVEGDEKEYEIWQKYYPQILNKEVVDKRGYFWAVTKVDVRENSCVLFGANSLTPTLYTEQKSDSSDNKINLLSEDNKFKQPETFTKGVTMTIEELQAEVIRLSAENATLKGSQETAVKSAVKAEQDRILGIQKSAETFGIKGSLEKFIKSGADIDSCTGMFELIKEQTQLANPSPKSEDQGSLNSDNTQEVKSDEPKAFGGILEGFKSLAEQKNIFANVK
jgi:hypothetical protein